MSYQLTELTIKGQTGDIVPCQYITQKESGDWLAILLPGSGYTCAMPLLYYTTNLLLDMGADVLQLNYDYAKKGLKFSGEQKEQSLAHLRADAELALQTVLAAHIRTHSKAPARVTFVSKSLGTIGAAHLIGANSLSQAGISRLEAVWFTPILSEMPVAQALQLWKYRSFMAIGSADPYFNYETIDSLKSNSLLYAHVLSQADHSLDVPEHAGGVSETLKLTSQLFESLKGFFSKK